MQEDLLLHNETQQDFGYNISDLSRGSVRHIWHKCVLCKKPKKTKFRYFVLQRSLAHQRCKSKIYKQTVLDKYGVENISQLKEIKQRKRQTSIENYGVDNPNKLKQVIQKQIQTKIERGNLKPKLQYPEYSKQYWLSQTFWDECKVVEEQDFPEEQWSQGSSYKIAIECSCGKIWSPSFNEFTSGKRRSCGKCSPSWGEKQLGELLELLFPNQVTKQDNLDFLGRQRVDFAIRDLKLVLEYDGKQHYEPVEKYGGEKAFKQNQERDRKKEKLLKQNNYYLVRIRYDQPLTESFLKKSLKATIDLDYDNIKIVGSGDINGVKRNQ